VRSSSDATAAAAATVTLARNVKKRMLNELMKECDSCFCAVDSDRMQIAERLC
jgi:hypothetical protein